ncbi:MAG: hypothetical protein IT367_14065 [Candidatus Hydrogenedentes bacterium]|nr:hypothetical protein [Candidatus Hydrogenedentota bacterium]
MGITYVIQDDVIRFTTHGAVDFVDGLHELQCGFAEASDITAKDATRKWLLLFDVRESTESRTSGELRDIATLIASHRGLLRGRCAIIVSKPLYYGLGRMFAVFMESFGLTTAVLHSDEEALHWLHAPVH